MGPRRIRPLLLEFLLVFVLDVPELAGIGSTFNVNLKRLETELFEVGRKRHHKSRSRPFASKLVADSDSVREGICSGKATVNVFVESTGLWGGMRQT